MVVKGIRGAITVNSNTEEDIKSAVIELLNELIKKNNIIKDNISHVIFTTTPDLNAEFPAKFARLNLEWEQVAMMCFHEMDVQGALPMCLRILIVYNCQDDFKPEFVYLKGAQNLRK